LPAEAAAATIPAPAAHTTKNLVRSPPGWGIGNTPSTRH